MKHIFLSLMFLTALVLPVFGAEAPTTIELRSGVLAGPEDRAGLDPSMVLDRFDLDQGGSALLKFSMPVTWAIHEQANTLSIRLSAPLGRDAYIAWLPEGGLKNAEELEGLAWAAPYHPGLRIAPEIISVSTEDPREVIPVTVHVFAHADVSAIARRIEHLEIQVRGMADGRLADGRIGERAGRIVLTLTPKQLITLREMIARWPEVFWIGRRPTYRLMNDATIWVVQSGLDAGRTTPIHDQGIYGEDQVIGILDTGLDADMSYFRDQTLGLPVTNIGMGTGTPDPNHRKVLIVDFLWDMDDPEDPTDWDDHGHGTHVAGIATGDDFTTPVGHDHGDGIAPKAKLVIQDGGVETDDCADIPALGCPVADLQPFFEQAMLQGAHIHSNSWGDRENYTPHNIYSDGSEDADAFMWAHPEFLLVFAAGNEGSDPDTIISPATAKNVIAAGSTLHDLKAERVAGSSSRGKTADGRIKPDVMAPGSSILSADSDDDITTNNTGTWYMSGTSMATPAVAGSAALVREYYQRGFYPGGEADAADGFTPSAALLKATLIGSAQDMTYDSVTIPNDKEGWGRVLLDDGMFFHGENHHLFVHDETAGFGSSGDPAAEHLIDVVGLDEPLKVILVWTDYPSTPAAAINLVNNLDLEVVAPNDTVYSGNNFVDGFTVPGGSADFLNNVEVVNIDAPQAGQWTVRIVPTAIPQPTQGYALVATGRVAMDGVSLDHDAPVPAPVGGNGDGVLEPGEWFDLPLTLTGSGISTATNVQATLQSLSSKVTVDISDTSYLDLATGQQAISNPHLRFHLATDFPCGAAVTIRLTYQADGFTRTEDLSFPTGGKSVLYVDDFEEAANWAHIPMESTAATGDWLIADPDRTPIQPDDDTTEDPGHLCFFTALNPGGNDNVDDVDDGVVVGRSGAINLEGHPEARLQYNRWFASSFHGNDPEDYFRFEIRENKNGNDILIEEITTWDSYAQWTQATFRVTDYVTPGRKNELKVSASDGIAHANRLEAAIDDLIFWDPVCEVYDPAPASVQDLRTSREGTDLRLDWNRPDLDPDHGGAQVYRIYRSETPSGGYALQDELIDSGESLTWLDTGAAGTTPSEYYYEVIAANDAGESDTLP